MRSRPRMGRRGGFVLVLVVGVLGLLLLVGVSLIQVAAEAHGGSETLRRSARARLAAGSAMEYAASRLGIGGFPQFRDDAGSRGDDWTCREPVLTPIERARNPSFSHGEPWVNRPFAPDGLDNDADGLVDEPLEGGGVFEPGEAFVDRDGDGSFTPASGRLRGESGGRGGRFLLRVAGADGGFPVNAGAIWAEDLHGSKTGVDFVDGVLDTIGDRKNGIPDHRDLRIAYHIGLAHALDNLGAILAHKAVPLLSTRCEDVPTGSADNPGEPRQTSWLGHDLIGSRPAGGYRSMDEVRNALDALGYERWEIDNVLPFLDLGPYDTPSGAFRCTTNTYERFYPYAPIGLASAPSEILEACWRYLFTTAFASDIPGEPPGWMAECTRTGLPGLPGTLQYGHLYSTQQFGAAFSVILYPDEAEALARSAALFRQQGSLTWKRYLEWLSANAETIFERECAELADGGYPENAFGWGQTKAQLAFFAVCMDPPVGLEMQGGATGATWGLDRDNDPANGVQPQAIVGFYGIVRAKFPRSFGDPNPWPAGAWPQGGPGIEFHVMGDYLRPQGLSMAAPVAYRIAAWGSAGEGAGESMEGTLRRGERLDFASQEDFECHAPGSPLSARGVRVDDPVPQTRREIRTDTLGTPAAGDDRTYPHVASLPRFNKRGIAPLPQADLPPFFGYSRCYGALSLAAREGGPRLAERYWAFSEDFDGMENLLSPPGPASPFAFGMKPNREFWSEPAGPGELRAPASLQIPAGSADQTIFPNPLKGGTFTVNSFQCPGLNTGGRVRHMAIEGWMSPSHNRWRLTGSTVGLPDPPLAAREIYLTCLRDPKEAGVTLFRLKVSWPSTASNKFVDRVKVDSAMDLFTAADEGLTRLAWDYHVVLLIQCDDVANTTTFRLFVNGSDERPGVPGTQNEITVARVMRDTPVEGLAVYALDELRLYGPSVPLPELEREIQRCWEVERYVRQGSYASPTYVYEEGRRKPDQASWLGFIPPAFHLAANPVDPVRSGPAIGKGGRPIPLQPFSVHLDGFSTRPGEPGHPALAPGFPKLLPYDATTDLRSCGEIRSFRYRVRFDAAQLAGVMDDSPVFESLWLTSYRADRPASWSGWSSR